MRVLVCGGRNYADRERVFATLDFIHAMTPIARIINGGANGADALSEAWAQERGVQVQIFPADWRQHGPAAGPIRNRQMLLDGRPDMVVAFPGGPGTANMVAQARRCGVQSLVISDTSKTKLDTAAASD